MSGAWTAFRDEMPPPKRLLLVTNNIDAFDAHGEMSHVWLVHMVHGSPETGVTAFDEADRRLFGLTHWRLALLDASGTEQAATLPAQPVG